MQSSSKSVARTPYLNGFCDPTSAKQAFALIEQKKKELVALADGLGLKMSIVTLTCEGDVSDIRASLEFGNLHAIVPQTRTSHFEQVFRKPLPMDAIVGSDSVKSESEQRSFLVKLICEIQWRHDKGKHLPKIPKIWAARFKPLKDRSVAELLDIFKLYQRAGTHQ